MTDYPSPKSSWRRREQQAKFSNLLAIFITVILLLAVGNGVLKGFSLEKNLGKSSWKSESSLLVAVNTNPGSFIVFQNDPVKLALFTFDEDVYFATGDFENPIEKLSHVFESDEIATKLSGAVHLPVGHFIIFKNKPVGDLDLFQKYFKNFASITTPFEIIANFPDDMIASTNLTRSDMFRLWWGLKSYRIEDLILSDFGSFTAEAIIANGEKVNALDEQAIGREVSKYLENHKVSEERLLVTIKNASGTAGAGELASDMVATVGAHVVRVEADDAKSDITQVIAGRDSYTAAYLANLLGCDIKTADNVARDEVVVKVGRDFAQKYY